MRYPPAIQQLINQFSQLPAVGPKTAERYVLYLLKQPAGVLEQLAANLLTLKKSIVSCSRCGSLTAADPCPICSDTRRNQRLLCLVAETKELIAIENSHSYIGLYYILGGVISTINGIGPEKLALAPLLTRLRSDTIDEVVLAFNPDVDGETTALYLVKLLKPLGIKISRLARGLPSGASLDYADELTIANALKFRNQM